MKKVYIVKKFGPVDGYKNLYAFETLEQAEIYTEVCNSRIAPDNFDETIEIEKVYIGVNFL